MAHPGCSFAWAVITTKRQAPPGDEEINQIDAERPRVAGAAGNPPAVAPEEGQIGYWKLDESGGTTATDSSGRGHPGKTVGKVEWGPGKVGGALKLNGTGGYVELPSCPEFDTLEQGSYTLMAWVKPDGVPAGDPQKFAVLTKTGFGHGLVYDAAQKYQIQHYFEGGGWGGTGAWTCECPPGTWHHVAGVVDKAAMRTRIYVDGRRITDDPWKAGSRPIDSGNEPWKIGMGSLEGDRTWSMKGSIDEVRIFNKALEDADVERLYKKGLVDPPK
jgi:hypothetical protein